MLRTNLGRLPIRLLPFLCLAVLTAGCKALEPEYAYVDSMASRSAAGLTRYVLLSSPKHYRDGGSLPGYVRKRHEGFVEMAHEVLGSAGFEHVESPEDAEVVVVLDYGIEVAVVSVRTERTSYVQLAAYDWEAVRDADRRNAIWRTRAYMDGSSGGLGRVVPILLEAMRPYVGTRTDGAMEAVVE